MAIEIHGMMLLFIDQFIKKREQIFIRNLFHLRSNGFAQNTRYKTSAQSILFGELSHNLIKKSTL